MIHLSFSSVLMTVLMSNLMLVLIAVCFRNEKVMAGIGHKLLTMFCIMTLARLLIPLELPFAKTLALPKTVSYILTAFQHPFGSFLGIDLSLWTAFCIIWPIGAIVYWVKFSWAHDKVSSFFCTYGTDVTNEEPYASMLKELCSEKQRQKIKILTICGIDSPVILGLFRPKIMLPMEADVSNEDTIRAIKHEVYHYAHHDLWVRTITKYLTLVYWWNPYCRQLNKRIDAVQEMRIDDAFMKKGPLEAMKYVLSIYHHATDVEHKDDDNLAASLCSQERSSLHKRLYMMWHHGEKKNHLLCIVMLLLMACLYIGSYLVILEPATYGSQIQGDHISVRDSIYAIENEDGSYDVYMISGTFLETVDTLEYYYWDIPIYSSEEKYHEKNQ